MSISTILASAMKQISWGQISDVAMKYGPDIVRKLQDRFQPISKVDAETVFQAMEHLHVRISELESAVAKQEEIIEQYRRTIANLEEISKTLQARLNIFISLAVFSALLSIVIGILLLSR